MIVTPPLPTGIVSLRTTHNPGKRRFQIYNDNDVHTQSHNHGEYCTEEERQYKSVQQTHGGIERGVNR